MINSRAKRSREKEWDDRPDSVTVKLARLSLSILKYIPLTREELAREKDKGKTVKKTKKR